MTQRQTPLKKKQQVFVDFHLAGILEASLDLSLHYKKMNSESAVRKAMAQRWISCLGSLCMKCARV